MLHNMKVIVSNPGLGSHVRQTVRAYDEGHVLDTFYTTILLPTNYVNKKLFDKYKGLRSRQFKELAHHKVSSLFLPELCRLFSSKFFSNTTTDKIWEWSEHFFDNWVAQKISKEISVFHGYEHASLASLKKCKSKKIFSVYEQPSAHHQFFTERIVLPLLEKEHAFRLNFKELFDSDLSKKRNSRRDEELKLADLIICNSTYVKNTLLHAGITEDKIQVLPLGFPEVIHREVSVKSKLRFLVSGNLSYLKGVHHILRLWKKYPELFSQHELFCIGTDTLDPIEWEGLPKNVQKMNRMNSVDYLQELSKADVYLLNSYSDGFGMVMSEAMANGLAVIGTENSAAPDIIQQDITGKIIPVANEVALLEAMTWMIAHPEDLVKMRMAAMEYAKGHSWDTYRLQVPLLVKEQFDLFKANG